MASAEIVALEALLGPLIQQAFDQIVWPLIVAEAGKVSDPTLAALIVALEAPVKTALDAKLAAI
jgi:hypothetical protein